MAPDWPVSSVDPKETKIGATSHDYLQMIDRNCHFSLLLAKPVGYHAWLAAVVFPPSQSYIKRDR
jgi:hypothetical protein